MQQIDLQDAHAQLSALVDAAMKGKTVFIVGNHNEMVQLVPVSFGKKPHKAGSAKGQIIMSDDFTEYIDETTT